MTIKEREILFKLHEAVKTLNQPPQTTNTALTGQVVEQLPYQSGTNPLPILSQSKPQG
jgi:hypothetical protein